LAEASPQTPLRELTALPCPLARFEVKGRHNSKGRGKGRKGGGEGRGGEGKEMQQEAKPKVGAIRSSSSSSSSSSSDVDDSRRKCLDLSPPPMAEIETKILRYSVSQSPTPCQHPITFAKSSSQCPNTTYM